MEERPIPLTMATQGNEVTLIGINGGRGSTIKTSEHGIDSRSKNKGPIQKRRWSPIDCDKRHQTCRGMGHGL